MPAGAERFLRQLERSAKVALFGLDLGPFAQHGLELTATALRPGHPRGFVEDRRGAARELDPSLGIGHVSERAGALQSFETGPSGGRVLDGPIDPTEREEDQRELVLDRGDLALTIGGPEKRQ